VLARPGTRWLLDELPELIRRLLMLLWILAVILAIIGVVQLLQGQIILAIVLFIAACLVGPGGYSIFGRDRTV
jgi:hypothetical protein